MCKYTTRNMIQLSYYILHTTKISFTQTYLFAKSLFQGFCCLYTTCTDVATQVLTVALQARSYWSPIWMLRGKVSDRILGLNVACFAKTPLENEHVPSKRGHFKIFIYPQKKGLSSNYCSRDIVSFSKGKRDEKLPSLKLGWIAPMDFEEMHGLEDDPFIWSLCGRCYVIICLECAQLHVTWGI